jgi:RNA polymerase-binding transcription factor DksA
MKSPRVSVIATLIRRRQKQLQEALARRRQRSAHRCSVCGELIGDVRLKLMPETVTCASCQRRLDATRRP